MSHVTRKSVFRVCDQIRLEPVCSADETSYTLEISAIASRYYTIQAANIKGADQTVQADLRLCCSHNGINRFSHDIFEEAKTSLCITKWFLLDC